MIADIITIGVCGSAGFLFLRGFMHAGAITRILVDQGGPPPMPFVPERDLRKDEWEEYCRKADAAELETWHKTGVWWLDPERWGEVPYSKPVHDSAPVVEDKTRCPACGEQMQAMATYAGVPHVWDCAACADTYRVALGGKLKRKPRKPYLHALGIPALELPCGCPYERMVHERIGPRHRTTTCTGCGSWWEPPSNSANARDIAQGEVVHRRRIPSPAKPEKSTL